MGQKRLDVSDTLRVLVVQDINLGKGFSNPREWLTLSLTGSAEQRRNVLNYIRTRTYVSPWESAYQAGDGAEGRLGIREPSGKRGAMIKTSAARIERNHP